MKGNRKYLFLLLLGTAFWGISVPLAKEGISIVNPFVFLMYRFLIATLVLSVFFYQKLKKIDIKSIKYGFVVSVPLIAALAFQTVCLNYTTSSNTAFIAGLDVLLVPVFKMLLFKKKVYPKVWLACIVALAGLSIITMHESLSFNYGDGLAVIGAVFFAIYIVIVGKLSYKNYDVESSVVVQMASGFVLCLIISFFVSSPAEMILPNNMFLWKSVFFAGILGTAFMYCIQNKAQKYIEDEKIALTYLCEPIFATLAAYFIISEDITLQTLVGGGLIIFSLFIAEYKFKYISILQEEA